MISDGKFYTYKSWRDLIKMINSGNILFYEHNEFYKVCFHLTSPLADKWDLPTNSIEIVFSSV